MIIIDAPSTNFDPRRENKKIKYLILHYTGMSTAFESLQLLQGGDPAHQVSAHYLIDEEGGVVRIVDEAMRAWHAGKSCWERGEDVNSSSIGIEIQNPGHEPFPDVQIKTVVDICRDILERHKILPYHVLAHSDIAPLRKSDPGEKFPWASLAQQEIGLWPDVTESDELDAEEVWQNSEEIKSLLTRYGYDLYCDLKTLVTAFQRHFEPEIFNTPEKIGIANLKTVSRMQALIRQKLALRPKILYRRV
ncbi:MAG: N-acetylmuramoyl-L-alanine amidase [Alphaproteobacteria bacterium]|nr:N-acetylmuramoyl-L-alanine amidase [Alphaproteobacteria bacterium]